MIIDVLITEEPDIFLIPSVKMPPLGIRSGISRLRGQWQNHEGRDFMPVFHPSYLLRFRSREVGTPQHLTMQDLLEARRRLDLLSGT